MCLVSCLHRPLQSQTHVSTPSIQAVTSQMRASPRISMGERAVAPHPNRPGNGLVTSQHCCCQCCNGGGGLLYVRTLFPAYTVLFRLRPICPLPPHWEDGLLPPNTAARAVSQVVTTVCVCLVSCLHRPLLSQTHLSTPSTLGGQAVSF